jgi:hypothetical protein
MKTAGADPHSLMPPFIEQDKGLFVTKTFLIRYCEEEVEINDFVLYRGEIDVQPDYLNT